MKRAFFFLTVFMIFTQSGIFSETSSPGAGDGHTFFPVEITDTVDGAGQNGPKTLFVQSSFVQLGGGVNTGTGFEPYRFFGLADFFLDGGRGTMDFYIQVGNESFGLNSEIVLWPLLFKHVRAGVGLAYNLDFLGSISMTNSFLPGLYFQLRTGGFFSVAFHVNYILKCRTIYELADDKPVIFNHSLGAGLVLDFNLPGGFALDLIFSTYERNRVVVLGNQSVALDVSYRTGNWMFVLGAVARFIDPFCLSAYFYDADVKVGVRYLF